MVYQSKRNCLRIVPYIVLTAVLPLKSWAGIGAESPLCSAWQEEGEGEHKAYALDLRIDYINQNDLRIGTSKLSSVAASNLVNNGSKQEVPTYTKTTALTIATEYQVSQVWKVGIEIPVLMRKHSTLGTASDGNTAGAGGGQYNSTYTALGDAKLLGRYLGLTKKHRFGLIGGLKLATGSRKKMGTSTDTTVPGDVAIGRDLQPGTGTYDMIFGVFDSITVGKNWDYYSEGKYQKALNRSMQFKPGDAINVNLGVKYLAYHSFTPHFQLNLVKIGHDKGANADTVNSGGTIAYLSPGISAPIMEDAQVYAFVQVPVYQKMLGIQLVANYLASLGATYSF